MWCGMQKAAMDSPYSRIVDMRHRTSGYRREMRVPHCAIASAVHATPAWARGGRRGTRPGLSRARRQLLRHAHEYPLLSLGPYARHGNISDYTPHTHRSSTAGHATCFASS